MAALAAAATLMFLPGCSADEDRRAPTGAISEEDVRNRVGQRVELEVETTRVLSRHAFTVGGQAPGENPLLVVAAEVPADLQPGDTVTITGTVEVLDIAGWEDVLDVDIDAEEAEEYAGEPAVRADSVTAT